MKTIITHACALLIGLAVIRASVAQDTPGDYTSKVPKYKFANTLAEQEAQLETNPLLQRLRESRKKLVRDPHLPLYHLVSPENRLNDPNGLASGCK